MSIIENHFFGRVGLNLHKFFRERLLALLWVLHLDSLVLSVFNLSPFFYYKIEYSLSSSPKY
jgi:hypothetical protein